MKEPDENPFTLSRIAERSAFAEIQRFANQLNNIKQRNPFSSPTTLSTIASIAGQRNRIIEEEKELLDRIESLSKELIETRMKRTEKEKLVAELQQTVSEYKKQGEIKYLIGKINKAAESHILTNPEFLSQFEPGQTHEAYVMSIDIRLSTELMLNAKTPDDYAKFITVLCDKLTELVINNGGVFDKFTGDGVLAFFPRFYSGDDAGYRALLTATNAISFFKEHYLKHRRCFRVVIAGTGLGVGIDFGTVKFVNIGESLSVVGNPVVYACRLSAAPAGSIFVNQPAQEDIESRYQANTVIEETILSITGSEGICVYEVNLKGKELSPKEFPWKEA